MSHQPPKVHPKPGQVKVVRALYNYTASQADELSFKSGDLLYVYDQTTDKDWWKARCGSRTGIIPSNYVKSQYTKHTEQVSNGPKFVFTLDDSWTPLQRTMVESQTESVDTPLHEAARRGNLSFLQECLTQGVSATGLDSVGNTAIHWASRGGHTDCLVALLAATAIPHPPIDAQNKMGDTALHLAAAHGHLETVAILVQGGARPDVRNKDGHTPAQLGSAAVASSLRLSRSQALHARPASYAPEDYEDQSD